MIIIEKTEVLGWEYAIRGVRNPMNSWEKSDSYPAVDCGRCGEIEREGSCVPKDHDCREFECFEVGPNDHALMTKLVKNGSVHAKYRRMIVVYMDITAPLYWWKEFDTYRVGVTPNPTDIEINSCSTMHKIHEKEFTFKDFSCEHLTNFGSWSNKEGGLFTEESASFAFAKVLGVVIDALNGARLRYLDMRSRGEGYSDLAKQAWWQMIQLLPSSYNQRRTIMLNYEVLSNIYKHRKEHKLDEWRKFCEWIKGLPYSDLITEDAVH